MSRFNGLRIRFLGNFDCSHSCRLSLCAVLPLTLFFHSSGAQAIWRNAENCVDVIRFSFLSFSPLALGFVESPKSSMDCTYVSFEFARLLKSKKFFVCMEHLKHSQHGCTSRIGNVYK